MRLFVRSAASLAVVAAVAASLALSGCGASARTDRPVHITLEDFKIVAPAHIASGDVDLVVHNKGPDAHELIVVRATKPLPMRTDGVTADEDAFEKITVLALEPGAPGGTRHVHLNLEPGHYVLICNMSGHYLGGMRTPVDVT
jgi:uncharacterized cupredoxin-like copper-binding protein